MMAWLNKAKWLRHRYSASMYVLGISLLLVGLIACGAKEEVSAESPDFSEEVEEVLQKRMAFAQKTFAADPRVIELVEESNAKNDSISLSEIENLDAEWIAAEGINEFIKGFLTNEASQILLEFQDTYDGYPEIFIADSKGLIVGLTNKTSDYYQADEEWWVEAYNNGQGKASHGEIEFDESALSEAIALYIPVMTLNNEKAIGVIKVVVDIIAIKLEL